MGSVRGHNRRLPPPTPPRSWWDFRLPGWVDGRGVGIDMRIRAEGCCVYDGGDTTNTGRRCDAMMYPNVA